MSLPNSECKPYSLLVGLTPILPFRYIAGQVPECMARCLVMAGARPGDPVQITPSFGLFNGGFGFYHGARKAGMFVIPTGTFTLGLREAGCWRWALLQTCGLTAMAYVLTLIVFQTGRLLGLGA